MQNKTHTKSIFISFISSRINIYFWTLFFIHLSVAVIYKEIVGINIEEAPVSNTWDDFWQNLPIESLRTRPIESIWNMHAQPPLHNSCMAFFVKFFYPNHLKYLHFGGIILGSLLSGMLFFILLRSTNNRMFSFATALILSINPSMFLYEAYMIYTFLTAFLVGLCVYFLSLYSPEKRAVSIYGFILALNLLILTRSVYHIIILFVAIPFICLLAGQKWRKFLTYSIIISLLSFGWYGKNYIKFGTFAASSWGGLMIWKVASRWYSEEELEALAKDKILDDVAVKITPFKPAKLSQFGFNQKSDVDVLSRDNYHNINLINLSKMFSRNGLRLVRHDPVRYFRMVYDNYKKQYCKPSSEFKHIARNAAKIPLHTTLSSRVIQGQAVMGPSLGSFLFFLLPLSIFLYLLIPIRMCGISGDKWIDYLRSDAVMFSSVIFIFYTTVMVCLFSDGEHSRYKFLVEQILWAFIASVSYRYISRFLRRRP